MTINYKTTTLLLYGSVLLLKKGTNFYYKKICPLSLWKNCNLTATILTTTCLISHRHVVAAVKAANIFMSPD